ncbi:NUDIX domain-containing protein [Candidatus Saccharibacteria bacterium]|nr:NUDIX domain-containing protein [Candidatus Saccharibacteria bacterium]
MNHIGELWQLYDLCGERVFDGGFTPAINSPAGRYIVGCAVMLYRFKDGEVEYLFQKRSAKVWNALKWDVSTGGHINYGEKATESAVREAREEIGVTIKPENLEFYARFVRGDGIVNLFFYDYTGESGNFEFDDEEVAEVKWVKYSDIEAFWPNFKELLQNDKFFKISLEEYNEKILKKYE